MTEVGAIYMASHPGLGNVIHDAGQITFAPGLEFEEIAVSRGTHEVYSDPSIVERVVCDVLG